MRRSSARSRRSGCRGAGRSRRGAGRRCGRRRSRCRTSRAPRARRGCSSCRRRTTAAKRVGVLDAGLREGVAVEAEARDLVAAEVAPRRRNASGFWSMTATEWPLSSRFWASVAPTRPQPMITKCTARHAIPCGASAARALRRVVCAPGGPSIAHRVGPLGCRQTPVARTSRPQRHARPHAPAEAHRAAGLRVGRALVGGVRARRDPADAVAGRRSAPWSSRRGSVSPSWS